MTGFFQRIVGIVTLELTSADPGKALNAYSALGFRILQPQVVNPLTLRFQLPSRQWSCFSEMAIKRGDSCRVVARQGFLYAMSKKKKRLPFLAALCGLILFSLYAPSRLWFFRVEGNDSIPTGEIIAVAQECGLTFWAKIEDISSEEFKNQILNRIPELQWAGVNFSGGVATINVRQRLEGEPVRDSAQIANVVAARDGIIVSMSVLGGQALCQTGQAVTAGELLVTGCIEHEYQTQYTCADAEIYALTQRVMTAVYPQNMLAKHYTGQESHCLKLIWGRNKIKISGNGRILGTTCDKMTQVKVLTLPGGYVLPVALVKETFRVFDPVPSNTVLTAQTVLKDELRRYVQADMVAGEILEQQLSVENEEGVYRLSGIYSCREMIARQRKVTLFEGENTNDGANGECRTS